LNLIRVMPAKGQDMPTSIYLARLIGPITAVIGAGMLVNPRVYRALAEEFLRSHALIYLSGLLSITGGLAVVLSHNVWTADWRIIITVLGWLALLGGIVRIVAPQTAQAFGGAMFRRSAVLPVAGIIVVLLGAILCFFGYLR
jgi:hypothetical protein